MTRRPEQADPEQQVPARVQARERRELVGQARRLERAVRVGALRHGVDQAEPDEPRRCKREQAEEQEADAAGDEHCSAEPAVDVAADDEEDRRGGEDHRPVTPDVDPVGEVDEPFVPRDRALQRALPVDPERPLGVDQPVGVHVCGRCVAGGHVADREVREHRARDERRLPRERDRGVLSLRHAPPYSSRMPDQRPRGIGGDPYPDAAVPVRIRP